MCGFCVVPHSVRLPVAATYWASAERGSMAFGISLCRLIVSFTTTSAFSNASSISPPATVHLNATLFGTSSWICAAPSWADAFGLIVTSSGS